MYCHPPHEPRGERSLNVGLDVKTKLNSLLSEQTCPNHYVGVGGVGARSNSSNNNRTVVKLVIVALIREIDRLLTLVSLHTETLEVNVLVVEALKGQLAMECCKASKKKYKRS
jgi:hypothetical protein